MTSNLHSVTFDANDAERLAQFWAALLGWDSVPDDDGFQLVPTDGTAYRVSFYPSQEQKTGPNQTHFDLTSATPDEQQQTVAKALELGATHLDVGQTPEEGHIVLADPEGNEFCVIPAGNNFLADTAFIGAINCDGTQAVGYFWSEALGWPLVWDQDEETAIQAPEGGSKMSWGGPPVNPKTGKNRIHLEIAPPVGTDQDAEVERLIALGAKHIDIGQGDDVSWVVMADPDGNEFCVLSPR
ncbi:VOC family protein [Aeromicrobium ginsengisoli]|uniref:VOC family protein n=1 Tax=Aeromicrobium ginsengisoli TaxID=363867 RepID=A0A5M4FHE9_9ACTN|nr:VOC family protein [Aeromicrobium ginsengisoli]KAA1399398.1 VOC family protein [Aeromicrobium ginsengisoli]